MMINDPKKIFLLLFLPFLLFINGYSQIDDKIIIPRIENFVPDGISDEWRYIPETRLYANQFGNYPQPEDFAGRVKLGWENENLLLAFTIQDNGYLIDTVSPWNADAIEIYLSPFKGSEDILQIEIVPLLKSTGECFVKIYDYRKNNELRNIPVLVQAISQIKEKERFVEVQINSSAFGLNTTAGSQFAMQLYLDDADPEKGKKNQLQWYSVGYSYLSSFAMHSIVLSENESLFMKGSSNLVITDEKHVYLNVFGTSKGNTIDVYRGDSLLDNFRSSSTTKYIPDSFDLTKFKLNLNKDTVYVKIDGNLTGVHDLYFATRRFINIPTPAFDREIRNFVMSDRQKFPPENSTLFIGSSSIRMWYGIKDEFPELQIIHRGFGGSTIKQALHYMDKIVLPYQASTIILYEGDNDVAGSANTENILEDFRKFIDRVILKQPDTEILILSPKPSISRMKLWSKYLELHDGLRKLSSGYKHVKFVDVSKPMFDEHVKFVDVSKPMFDENGSLKKELFLKDGIHMNDKGYMLWTEVIRKELGLE